MHYQNLLYLCIGFDAIVAGSGSTGPFNGGGCWLLRMARSKASAKDFPSIVATAVALNFGVS
jgi:hypothetical protein